MSERRFWVWTRIRESNVWDPPHFPLLGTLIWLLIEAKKQQRPKGKGRQIVMKDGSALRLEAGQVTVNQRDMATELMVHHTTIGRRLRQLEKFGICAPTHAQRCTVVTILNWDSYQPEWAASAPTRAPATHQRRTIRREREKERKGDTLPARVPGVLGCLPEKGGQGGSAQGVAQGQARPRSDPGGSGVAAGLGAVAGVEVHPLPSHVLEPGAVEGRATETRGGRILLGKGL